MATLTGTAGADTITGTDGSDTIDGKAGNDVIDGGAGDDSIQGSTGNDLIDGGDGNDRISDDGGNDTLRGGAGDDTIRVVRNGTAVEQVRVEAGSGNDSFTYQNYRSGSLVADMGDGDDRVDLIVMQDGGMRLTLGTGQDTISFNTLMNSYSSGTLTITDFAIGAAGDKLDFAQWLNKTLVNWDGSSNPFGSSGYLRLVQQGTTTLLQMDRDGAAGGSGFARLVTFENATAAQFTADNFGGLPPRAIQNDDASLAIAPTTADQTEGNSSSKAFTFTVTRSFNTTDASTANWVVTGSGINPADATDFAGAVLPSGTVIFATGETSKTITVNVNGDSTVEPDDGFTVTLSGASAGTSIGTATATGVIRNDDGGTLIGTSGNDVLIGGAGPDTIIGLAGNDTLSGAAGIDTAVFSGSRRDYNVTRAGDTVTIRDLRASADGTDTLTGIEQAQFTDGLMGLIAEELVLFLPGTRDLITWDSTQGSSGFTYFFRLGASSSVAAVADFTGDGRSDVLLSQPGGGLIRWDTTLGGNGFAVLPAAPGFEVIARGDLAGNGATDLLLKNAAGQLRILDPAAGTITDLFSLATGWSVAGVGNINGTGKADVILQNNSSNAVIAFTDQGWRDLITLAPDWTIVGLGDVVGGLADDFILQKNDGVTIFWDTTQGGSGFSDFATIGPEWDFAGFNDLNGDGRDDVILQNDNGLAIYWTGDNWVDLGSTLVGTELVGTGVFP